MTSERLPRGSMQQAKLERVGDAHDVAAGRMRVFDVSGTKVNVAEANGQLYAFDDTCTHTPIPCPPAESDRGQA